MVLVVGVVSECVCGLFATFGLNQIQQFVLVVGMEVFPRTRTLHLFTSCAPKTSAPSSHAKHTRISGSVQCEIAKRSANTQKKVRCVRGARMCAQKMAKYNQKGKKTSATCTCECILISSERIVLRVEYNTPPHFMDWQSDSDSDNIYKYFYNLTSFAHVSPHSLSLTLRIIISTRIGQFPFFI